MPYVKEVCIAGKILEVRKYHTARYNMAGEKRGQKIKASCESQKRVNEREAVRRLARKMNANFDDDSGMLVTLTYMPGKRPKTSVQMGDDMRNFLKKLRKLFKAGNTELKYIYVKELGKRGAAHIHILMSACDVRELNKCWDKGFVRADALYSDGDYTNIARYFVKYAEKTEETEGKLIGKRWNSSRNLKEPVIIKSVVNANTFNKGIRERKGYVLDPDTVKSGYTELGYKYLSYKMRKAAPVQQAHKFKKAPWRKQELQRAGAE